MTLPERIPTEIVQLFASVEAWNYRLVPYARKDGAVLCAGERGRDYASVSQEIEVLSGFRVQIEPVGPDELSLLLKDIPPQGLVLVAGLGNRAITPDAIGPKVHNYTLVTRHLVRQMPETFGAFRPVASLAAEVMGTTGVESGELIQSLCEKICPHCVIAVDALASRSLHRLCRTVQLTDTGITPGSGVGNHRMGLDRKSLGVPVIAIGVPTVVDAATLAADLMGVEELPDLGEGRDLLVTPKDIDSQVGDLSKIIGYAIDLALQPGLTIEELELLLS